jgi:nucleoside-diphosphate kinase
VARERQQDSIRGLFGSDNTKNAAHGSDSHESATRELDLFFGKFSQGTSQHFLTDNITCVVVKPHLIQNLQLGCVVSDLQKRLNESQNLSIEGIQQFVMNRQCTQEFLEVYQGVLPGYSDMVNALSNQPCLVLAIKGDANVVNEVRGIVGPHDPQIAKYVRPNSLRALYGKNQVLNGLHVTDLEEDGRLECEYFFEILQEN